MNDRPVILVIGYNAFDVVVPVNGFPRPDSKYETEAILIGGGGPAATAAVTLARLGARVRLVTMLGDDLPGQLQRRELLAAGVDLELSMIAEGHGSAKAVILVDPAAEERTVFWSRGDLPLLDADAVQPEWLDGCDLMYCDGHEVAAATRLAGMARDLGLPVVMDAGSVRPGSAELVAQCTDVISSTHFAPCLTGRDDPLAALTALREAGPRRVAMTFGAAGCLALVGEQLEHVPAFVTTVKDTTGAGDAFHGGYAWRRAVGGSWLECLDFASAVAALKCRDWGGRRALPKLAEVQHLLDHGERRREQPPS